MDDPLKQILQATKAQKWESLKSDREVQLDNFKTIIQWKKGLYITTFKPMIAWIVIWGLIEILWVTTKHSAVQAIVDVVDDHKDKLQSITTFVLGFYVAVLYARFWDLYNQIPWPDATVMLLHMALPEDEHHLLRQDLIRYMLVSQALVFSWLSPAFGKEYPTLKSLIDINILTYDEKAILTRITIKKYNDCSYWTPYLWFQAMIIRMWENKQIESEMLFNMILTTNKEYVSKLGGLLITGSLTIPLPFTQVVTILVWSCWLTGCFSCHGCSKQNLSKIPLPIFPFLISMLLIGWLQATVILLYPFHAHSTGFNVVDIFERNLRVCKLMNDCPMADKYREMTASEDIEVRDTPVFINGDAERRYTRNSMHIASGV